MISGEKPLNQFDGELAALRHQRKMDALGESPAVDRVLDVTVKLAEKAGLANRMKKPADKMRLRYFLGVCSPIRENAHNQFMASTALQTPQRPKSAIYPTPPPFSPHKYENNDVTSIMTKSACQNKQLTSRSLPGICVDSG